MSTKRELIWFQTNVTNHWASTIAAGAMSLVNVTANATNCKVGEVPSDGLKRLNGTIEHISAYLATSDQVGFDVCFFRKSTGGTTAPSTDSYIDHESFAKTDFITWGGVTKPRRAGKSALAIPYSDSDASKKFHIGISNNTTAIPKNTLVIRWAWRPDYGEA